MTIVVSRTDKLGDMILSLPTFYTLRLMYPKAIIILWTSEYNYDIVKHLPYIDAVFKIEDLSKDDGTIDSVKWIEACRKIGFVPKSIDILVSLVIDKRITKFIKPIKDRFKTRIAPLSKQEVFMMYNKFLVQSRSKSVKNEAEYNLYLIREINSHIFDNVFSIYDRDIMSIVTAKLFSKIYYTDENINYINDFFSKNNIKEGDKLVALNLLAGGSANNLLLDDYVKLVEFIHQKDENAKIILTLPHNLDDYELPIANKEISITGKSNYDIIKDMFADYTIIYQNDMNILNLVALLDRVSLYIGSSTGPTHIAGAFHKPIIAFYPDVSTQSPTRWGTFSIRHNVDSTHYIVLSHDNYFKGSKTKRAFALLTDKQLEDFKLALDKKL